MIQRNTVCICDINAGIDLGFVDIKSATVFVNNFEHRVLLLLDYRVCRV